MVHVMRIYCIGGIIERSNGFMVQLRTFVLAYYNLVVNTNNTMVTFNFGSHAIFNPNGRPCELYCKCEINGQCIKLKYYWM